MRTETAPDFQISIDGHALITVHQGRVDVQGKDMPADISNMMKVIDVISDVVKTVLASEPPLAVAGAATSARKAVAQRVGNVCYLTARLPTRA